jgi:hypothetical protein
LLNELINKIFLNLISTLSTHFSGIKKQIKIIHQFELERNKQKLFLN